MSYKILVNNSAGYSKILYITPYSLPLNVDKDKIYDYQVWVELKDGSKDNYWIHTTTTRNMRTLANAVAYRYEYNTISKIHFNIYN